MKFFTQTQKSLFLTVGMLGMISGIVFMSCDDSKYDEGNNLNGPFKLTSSSPSNGQSGTEQFNSPYIFLKFNNTLDPEDYDMYGDDMKKRNNYEDMYDIFSPGNNLRIYSVYVLGYDYDDYSKKSAAGRQDPYANLQQQVRKQAFLSGLEAVDAKAASWYKNRMKKGQRSNSSMEKTTSEDVPNNILVIELERIDDDCLLFDVGQEYRLHVNKEYIVDAFDNKLEEDIDISFTPEQRLRLVDLSYYTDTYEDYSYQNTIFAQFNDKVDPSSIANTISSQPSHPWTQIVEPYSCQTSIRYNSLEALAQNTTYQVTVQGNIRNMKGVTVSNSMTKTIKTDYLRVIDTEPDHGETGVDINTSIEIEYNNSIASGTVTLSPAVTGNVYYGDEYVTFYPSQPLVYDTTYTVTVTNVKDWNNNTARDTTFSFTTEPFQVVASSPSNGSINVERDMEYVHMDFTGNIDTASVKNAVITIAPADTFTRVYSSNSVHVMFKHYLSASTIYTVNVSGVKSSTGKTMRPFELKFTTEPKAVWTPTCGLSGQNRVSINTPITISTNQTLDTSTIRGCFSINPSVPGTFSFYQGTTNFTFKPNSPLDTSKTYTVTIANTLKNKFGDNAAPYSFSFKTSNSSYIFYEGFETELTGWGGFYPQGWARTTSQHYTGSWSMGAAGYTSSYTDIQTPLIDLSSYSNATLSFYHKFNGYYIIYISFNGSSWYNIYSTSSVQPNWTYQSIPINDFTGSGNVKILFYYSGGSTDNYWYIDDVTIQ